MPLRTIVEPRIVLAGRLIDGVADEPEAARAILLKDGRIEAIVPERRLSTKQLTSVDVLDCRDCTVLSGLIDAHVHLTFSAASSHDEVRALLASESDERLALRAIRNAQAHLADGVTTLRDCGGRGMVTLAVRDAIRDGVVVGPRVAACGPAITTATGHLHYLNGVAEGKAAVKAMATRVLDDGADFVKICATGGIMTAESDPMASQYSVEELRAAVKPAHARKALVAVHVLAYEGLRRSVEAGIDTLEHCLWQTAPGEFAFDASLAEQMIAQGAIAGLSFAGITQTRYREARLGQPPPGDLGVWQPRLQNRYAAEAQMIAAGVPYVVHTDAGVRDTPFGEFWIAMATMAWELQLPAMAVIRAATATAARALGWQDDLGTLTPGKRADMVIVRGDPLSQIEALREPKTVILDGRVVAQGGSVLVPPLAAA